MSSPKSGKTRSGTPLTVCQRCGQVTAAGGHRFCRYCIGQILDNSPTFYRPSHTPVYPHLIKPSPRKLREVAAATAAAEAAIEAAFNH